MFDALFRTSAATLEAFAPASRVAQYLRHHCLFNLPCSGTQPDVESKLRTVAEVAGAERFPERVDLRELSEWVAVLNATRAAKRGSRPRRVLCFTVVSHWLNFCLPFAFALAAADCSVDYVWVPLAAYQPACPENPSVDQLNRRYPKLHLHPRLTFRNLAHVPAAPLTDAVEAVVLKWARLGTCYVTQRELCDVQNEPDCRDLYRFRIERDRDAAARLQTLLSSGQYDSMLVPNGAMYEFGVAFDLAQMHGLKCVSFEMSERRGMIVVSDRIPAVDVDTDALWRADAPHRLTPEREERVAQVFRARERPDWKEQGYIWQGQRTAIQAGHALLGELGLSSERPVALLCTNLPWDSAVLGKSRAFSSMAEWLLRTVGWFADRPDWQLVIRVHPGEAVYGCKTPASQIVAGRYPALPGNVRLVDAAMPLNTYGLLPVARFGLVYASTIGLEMATRGMQVVVAGRVHYAGKGFTSDPADEAEYFAELGRLAAEPAAGTLTARQVEVARCYSDIFFNHFPRPSPWWDLEHHDTFMNDWPLERVLSKDCPPEFLDTLDRLAGRT